MQKLKFGDEIEIVLNDWTEMKAKIGLSQSVCSIISGAHIGDLHFDGKIEKDGKIIGWLK